MIRYRGTLISKTGLRFSIFWGIWSGVLSVASLIIFLFNGSLVSLALFFAMGVLAILPQTDTLKTAPQHLRYIMTLTAAYVVSILFVAFADFGAGNPFWGWLWLSLAILQSVASFFIWKAYKPDYERTLPQ